MKLLILGGTRFLGRHLLTAALANNHEVTLFNRGHETYLPPASVETIHGDRHHDLSRLQGRRWDAVIDTCGMLPRAVRDAAKFLTDSVDSYAFISTQNVYSDVSVTGIDESSPMAALTADQLAEANSIDTSGEPSYGKMYGGLKAMCEQAAEEVMPGRVLNISAGFDCWSIRLHRPLYLLGCARCAWR